MNILKYPNCKWSIPVLFSNDEYILAVFSTLKRINIQNPITYAYGMVPSLWTGGRNSSKKTQDKAGIEKLLRMVLDTGSIPTFTMSRYDITKEDLKDEFCNWILDFGVANGCNFIMTSDILYNYIKSRYPEAKCVASVLKPIYELELQTLSETDYYNMLSDKFDRVVVRPEYAKDTLLNDYEKISDISKLEVLINQICVPNCKVAQREHLFIPKSDWSEFMNIPIERDFPKCPRIALEEKSGYKSSLTTPSLMFTESEVDHLVNDLGIINLKLQGRNYGKFDNTRMINNYLFEGIGDYQNISPIIWGMCENLRAGGVIPV